MRPRFFVRLFIGAVLQVGLLGCAATVEAPFPNPVKAANNFIASFTVPPNFRQAVQWADWDTAAELHAAHPDLLDREAPQEVEAVAAAQNAQWQSRLLSARQALGSAMVVDGFSPEALAGALSVARVTLQKYEGQKVLARRMSDEATALKQAVDGVRGRFAALFPDIFAAYDHGARPLLLRDLPLPLDRATQEAAVQRSGERLLRVVRDAELNKAAELVRAYAPLQSEGRRAEMRSAYLTKASAARFGVAPNRLKPSQKLALATEGPAYGNLRVMRLDTGRAAAPVQLDGMKVESQVPLAQLDATLREAAAAGDSLIVLIDTSLSISVTEFKSGGTVTQRRQVGTQSRPNPTHQAALDEVSRLENELREVEQQNGELQRQAQALGQQSGGRGSGAMAALLGATFGASSVITTRNDLARARATLSSTPRMSDEPVFRDMPVQQLVRQTQNMAQPIVYLVDALSRQVHRASHTFTSTQRDTVSLAEVSTSSRHIGATGSLQLRLADFHAALDKASPRQLSQLDVTTREESAANERRTQQLQREADGRSNEVLKAAQAQATSLAAAHAAPAAGQRQPTGSAAVGGNNCHIDMSHLDTRLPRFRVPLLQNLRDEGVRVNVRDVIRRAKAQGVSAEDAVDQMLKSARSMDSQVPAAGQCAAEVDALGTSDEAFVEGIRKGGIASIATCDGIRNGCLCAGLSARLGAYVTRATAAAMQCHARSGGW